MHPVFVVPAIAFLADFSIGSPVPGGDRHRGDRHRHHRWTCRNNVITYNGAPASPGVIIYNIIYNNQAPRAPGQIGYPGTPGGTGENEPPELETRDELMITRSESDFTPVEDAAADGSGLSKRDGHRRRWECRNNVITYNGAPANPSTIIYNIIYNNQAPRAPGQIGFPGTPGGTGVNAPELAARGELVTTRSESDFSPAEHVARGDDDGDQDDVEEQVEE